MNRTVGHASQLLRKQTIKVTATPSTFTHLITLRTSVCSLVGQHSDKDSVKNHASGAAQPSMSSGLILHRSSSRYVPRPHLHRLSSVQRRAAMSGPPGTVMPLLTPPPPVPDRPPAPFRPPPRRTRPRHSRCGRCPGPAPEPAGRAHCACPSATRRCPAVGSGWTPPP